MGKYLDESEIERWVTIDGVHVPIRRGQNEHDVETQIQKTKAATPKSVNKEKFKDHAEEYVAGGVEVDRAFSADELEYIKENSKSTDKVMYRVEDYRFTAQKLDEEEFDPDDFKFNGSFRSFSSRPGFISEALDEDSDDYAGIANPVVFKVIGTKNAFDMSPYTSEYNKVFSDQAENFLGGRYQMEDEQMMKLPNGKYVRCIVLRQHS